MITITLIRAAIFIPIHIGTYSRAVKNISLAFWIPQKMRVQELQDLVAKKTGIPNDEQYIIHGGKKLEEQKTLGEYPALGNRATIFMVMRLPGGY